MRKVRDFTPADAEGLAKCINESEGGWPGGLTSGVQHTVEHVMEDYQRQVKLTWLIAVDERNQVAGISTLHPRFEDQEAAYLGFLNVSDAFRKKGYGKALLIESVERVRALGYKRLFLGTWAGNLNAVPAYKRAGFYWRPDTDVWMDNYIPTVLDLPITKTFFQKHNWYDSFVRKIEIEPDDMKHRGLHVYELCWQEDADSLRIMVDRESRGITLIETNDLFVECWVADPEPALGLPIPVEWTIRNKDATTPLHCKLKVTLPKGFQLLESPSPQVTVQPDETVALKGVIQGSVTVVPPIEEKAALAVKSQIMLGEIPVQFETGLRVKHPIEVSTIPTSLWCRPGTDYTLDIAIKSNLKSSAQGTLKLRIPKSLLIKQKQFELSLSPEGYSGVSIETSVDPNLKTIALPIRMHANLQVNGQPIRTRTETVYLHCLNRGGVLVTPFDDKRRLQVHTEQLHFSINLAKGAHIDRLTNKLTKREHLRSHCRESLGPPFWPSEQMQTHFKHDIHQPSDEITSIRTWMECKRFPELTFSKIFIISGNSDVLRINYGFENTNSTKTHEFKLWVSSMPGSWDNLHVIPLKDGILRAEFIEGEFFATDRELPKKREEWAETWYCAERPHKGEVTAILCSPEIFYEASGITFINFQLQVPPVSPKTQVHLPPLYLVCGIGTWQHMRQLWHQLYSTKPESEIPELPVYDAVDVRIETQPPLFDAQKELTVPIQVRHLVHRPLQGHLRLKAPKGWRIIPRTYKFKDLTRDNPLMLPITLTATTKEEINPDILSVHAQVQTPLTDYGFDLPIILQGKPGRVTISTTREHNQNIYVIDNGTYQLKVAAGFAGSVIALINKATGTNYLKSSFPEAGPLAWFNPWYGGIRFEPFPSSQPGWFPTKLDKESWSVKRFQRKGWQGVTISTKPGKKEIKLKGFKLELQVLTQPFSNIFALIGRVKNLTKAPRQIRHRIKASLPAEGSPAGIQTVIPRATTTYHRRTGLAHSWPTTSLHHFGVEHMKDDSTLVFIKKQGPMGELYQGILGQEVIMINNEDYLNVGPRSSNEQTSFLVVSKEPWERAEDYAILETLTL